MKKVAVWILLVAFGLTGCATMPNGQTTWSSPGACIAAHTVGGAAVGAGLGALVGALTGGGKGAGKGAIIGAAGGAFIGFAYAYGKCFAQFTNIKSQPVRNHDGTARTVKYNRKKGEQIKITTFYIDPSAVAPDSQPKVRANFYVATAEEKEFTVTETITLKAFDPQKKEFVVLGSTPPDPVVVKPSENDINANSELPPLANAEEGKFIIVFTVTYKNISDSKEMPLIITKDQTILAKAQQESQRRHHDEPVMVASADDTAQPGEKSAQIGSSNQTDSAPQASQVKYVIVSRKEAFFRENPEAKAKLVVRAHKDDKFPLIDKITVAGRTWYQVRIDDGRKPWVISFAVKISKE
jgi:hypothetical protein